MDLVLQDTPLNDPETERRLRGWVEQVNNLGDRDEQKLARVEVRFARVKAFLDYLKTEEEREENEFLLSRTGGAWSVSLMAPILEQVHREIEWIDRRLKQNRELFPDDVKVWVDEGSELLAEIDETEEQNPPTS